MGRESRKPRVRVEQPVPIPLDAIDLLAGLAPGVELQADDLPPGIDEESAATTPLPAIASVAEVGRQIRAGDGTVRRLIRTTVLRPERGSRRRHHDLDRAGVPPRTPDKPGE